MHMLNVLTFSCYIALDMTIYGKAHKGSNHYIITIIVFYQQIMKKHTLTEASIVLCLR